MNNEPNTETNQEFINRMIDFSRVGPLMQLFMLEAMTRYAVNVVADKENVIRDMDKGMISGHSWVRAAEELKRELEKKYGKAMMPEAEKLDSNPNGS